MGCLKLKSNDFAFVSATSADAEPANPFGNEGAHSDFPKGKMNYEYSPFGKMISKSGSKADDMTFRFSGYVYDTETDLVYYGYRYYDANMGRWINRDPIGEQGGVNLYAMVSNNPIRRWDGLGLKASCKCCCVEDVGAFIISGLEGNEWRDDIEIDVTQKIIT